MALMGKCMDTFMSPLPKNRCIRLSSLLRLILRERHYRKQIFLAISVKLKLWRFFFLYACVLKNRIDRLTSSLILIFTGNQFLVKGKTLVLVRYEI